MAVVVVVAAARRAPRYNVASFVDFSFRFGSIYNAAMSKLDILYWFRLFVVIFTLSTCCYYFLEFFHIFCINYNID